MNDEQMKEKAVRLAEAWWSAYADEAGDDIWRVTFDKLSPTSQAAWMKIATPAPEELK